MCEKKDVCQSKAIRKTRLVIADLALTSNGDKDELAPSSKREINSWWEWERIQAQRNDRKNAENKATPQKQKPKRSRTSSLESTRSQPEKKKQPTVRLDPSMIESFMDIEPQGSNSDAEFTDTSTSHRPE